MHTLRAGTSAYTVDMSKTPQQRSTEETVARASDLIEVLSRRGYILDRIVAGVTDRTALKDEFEESRSTVYRGLEQLVDHELVREETGNYVPTSYGRRVLELYGEFESGLEELTVSRDLLAELEDSHLLNMALLEGADVVRPDRHAPYDSLDHLDELVQEASHVKTFTPVLLPRYFEIFQAQLNHGAVSVEAVLERRAIEYVQGEWAGDVVGACAGDASSLYETDDQLPFGLLVVTEPEPETCVVVHGEDGNLKGLISNDTEAAMEWGLDIYAEFSERATRIPLDT